MRYEFRALGAQVGTTETPAPACMTSNSVFATDVVALPALTAAQANDLSVRISGTSTTGRTSVHDLASLALTWSR
jgi:hypothetical protein